MPVLYRDCEQIVLGVSVTHAPLDLAQVSTAGGQCLPQVVADMSDPKTISLPVLCTQQRPLLNAWRMHSQSLRAHVYDTACFAVGPEGAQKCEVGLGFDGHDKAHGSPVAASSCKPVVSEQVRELTSSLHVPKVVSLLVHVTICSMP